MQNIPGIALEKATEQFKTVSYSSVKKNDQQLLFADLFDQHSNRIEDELALTPVSTQDKMLDVAPARADEVQSQANTTPVEAPVRDDEDPIDEERDRDQLMTQEDLDAVREDLKEYGMTDEEIAEIEEDINSEDGMTWGQFVSTVADKMSDMRQVSLTGDQKDQLGTFFAKFGFNPQQSARLISQLENGEQAEVMAALKEKIDNMPDGKQMLFTKNEMEAFSAAMNFSKEFTSKIKEVFGKNMLSKDVKEAFTMLNQEMAEMDEKDQNLVRAVGKAFVKAMGDTVKESSAANDIKEAVDLKPRVSEDGAKSEIKEDLKDALDNRKDIITGANARKSEQKAMPEQDMSQQHDPNDNESVWNNFFSKLQDNSTQTPRAEFIAKTENIDSALKTGLAEATTRNNVQSWEKISAPKVMRQVENAFLQNLNNGTKQLTLQLNPENLGKLSVMLQVQGKEVSATIRAESADAAKVIAENIDIIKNSLENQGLKVDKLEVQTGLSGSNDFNDWMGQNQHNLSREREAMIAMRSHMKQMREGNGHMAQDMQNVREQARNADQGLHVIA